MTSTQYQDAAPPLQQSNPSQTTGYVMSQQQQKAMQQPSDARTAKRIKVEHGEEQGLPTSSVPLPSPSLNSQQHFVNGQGRSVGADQSLQQLILPTARSSQQMGPPSSGRPPASTFPSYNNGEAASPSAQSPSPQPSQQGSRASAGPGKNPYQFGMGLPTPGINFTRTPTTGSFVVSNNNSRQHTPTEQSRTTSRASPTDGKASGPSAGPAGPRKDGVDQLQDLLSISGVDLRAEEAAAQRTPIARASYSTANAAAAGQASSAPQLRESPFYLEIYPLSRQIHRIAAKHGLRVDPEVLTYLSLAAKTRFQNLLEAMIASSRHRGWSSHLRAPPLYEGSGQAMYHEEIHDDPLKLLTALTKVDKRQEQEARQARIQREEMEVNNANAGEAEEEAGSMGGDGASSGQATPADNSRQGGDSETKKKPKKAGTIASARNMSEDKRLKLTNKTVAQALGISSSTSKAWMFGGAGTQSPLRARKSAGGGGGASGSRLPKPRFAPVAAGGKEDGGSGEVGQNEEGSNGQGDGNNNSFVTSSVSVGGWGDLAARQRVKEEEERQAARRVNLQDALHALEMERSGGAGRGSGELILYTTRVLGRPPSRKL